MNFTLMRLPRVYWLQAGVYRGPLPSRHHSRLPATGGRGYMRRDVWAVGPFRLVVQFMPKS